MSVKLRPDARTKKKRSRHTHVGLQVKSAIILTCVVVGVVSVSAWSYYRTIYQMMYHNNRQNALLLGEALTWAADAAQQKEREEAVRNLAGDWIKSGSAVYVAIVDKGGRVISAQGGVKRWAPYTQAPLTAHVLRYHGPNHIIVAQPIIVRNGVEGDYRLSGGIRMVLDVSSPTRAMLRAKWGIVITAGLIILFVVPFGYLLVSRVMIRPIRQLVAVTHRLAEGDFEARSGLRTNDETGELACAFDDMAEEISSMRNELLVHQCELEDQVAERTEELQQTNDRLCEEMKDKEDLLRAVTHDLNAPMRNIAGMATMIMMKWRDQLPEDVIARLQRIQSNVDQQSSLITDLLELSYIRSRPERHTKEDIGEILRALTETFEYEIHKRNIELEIDEAMPTLWVEKNRIRQVFQNLIDNAIKYMHRTTGGRVVVNYRPNGLMHEFSVWDNGMIIPVDQQESIFTVFRRGKGASESIEGKGVGLTVVRTIVSNYGGRVWVQSEEGEGTTFNFTLAMQCTEPQPEEVISGA